MRSARFNKSHTLTQSLQEEEQQELNQDEQEQKEKDPNIEFKIDQHQDIPRRVTRSKNNISKQSTKYLTDYVTE